MSTPTRLYLHRPSSNPFSYSPVRRKVQATNISRSSRCHPWRAARPPWGPRCSPQPRHPVLQPQPEGTVQQWALTQDQALVHLLSPLYTPHTQSHQLPPPEEHGPTAAPQPSGMARNMGHGAAGTDRAGRDAGSHPRRGGGHGCPALRHQKQKSFGLQFP